ncbi:NAD(P)/FAD-dependent oxidoreductase [Herbiconiux sp. A18JL235]|uniref:NAD(P)/FAD-dependent oxidoreductase n=1 Tax=Herbiconiux sp. A18JL235 TaxID=3152363 RepID=A0AB39BL61_9MICO
MGAAGAAAGVEVDGVAGGEHYDVVVIGGGPAGLSVGLNLVRARRRVLILDSNRPRHSATLVSHGFITRDGVSPLELRALGREEFAGYPTAEFHQGLVGSLRRDAETGVFSISSRGVRGSADREVSASVVVLASGLAETLPALPSIRAYYGTSLHSCIECDGFEKGDEPLALIGSTPDLAERAVLVSQVSDDLIVFTGGAHVVTEAEEAALAARGVVVERRELSDVVGDRSGLTGVVLADGTTIARSGGFVRPLWSVPLPFAQTLESELERDPDGYVVVDSRGATSVEGLFAAGDITPPGPQQLIVAAGAGARVAAAVNRHLLGPL